MSPGKLKIEIRVVVISRIVVVLHFTRHFLPITTMAKPKRKPVQHTKNDGGGQQSRILLAGAAVVVVLALLAVYGDEGNEGRIKTGGKKKAQPPPLPPPPPPPLAPPTAAEAARLKDSNALLDAVEEAGAEFLVDLSVAHTRGGIGVVVNQDVIAGTTLFTLPASAMLTGSGPNGTGIPVTLIKERRAPSSEVFKRYIATLEMDCEWWDGCG